MAREFAQIEWDRRLADDWLAVLRLAVAEDLGSEGDWTSRALVPDDARGAADLVSRRAGVVSGMKAVEAALEAIDPQLRLSAAVGDGQAVLPGQPLGRIDGPARAILAAERLVLNVLGRLSGIATLTRRYVEAVAGARARIYDTRKTTPGWRRIEKYAVRCGGGWNHREGLFAAVLIKDNHLAVGAAASGAARFTPGEAVRRARQYLRDHAPGGGAETIVEVEVDRLDQLDEALAAGPDLVLLDNMPPETLRRAVERRDATAPGVELEASGGIDLDGVRAVAASGVERISLGALTHSAVALDVGLDWVGGR